MEGGGGVRYSTNEGQLDIENYSCHDGREGGNGEENRQRGQSFFQAGMERRDEE